MSSLYSRRDAMKLAGAGALAAAAGSGFSQEQQSAAATVLPGFKDAYKNGKYVLPPLPYEYEALAPLYESRIVRIHHDKHHAGYVKGMNAALEKLQAARKSGDFSNVKALSRSLAYNGSGHVLHTLFWNSMTPNGADAPGWFKTRAKRDFGSFDAMKKQFAAASKSVEASGWGVLAWEPIGDTLMVLQCENHQNLTIWGVTPLMVCDVWEHAYYLQYQTDRGKWVDNFMKLANWSFAAERLAAVTGEK